MSYRPTPPPFGALDPEATKWLLNELSVIGSLLSQTTFTVTAEEAGAINSATDSGYQWSFGDGATGSAYGFRLAYACVLRALTFQCDTVTTSECTIEVYRNGASTGVTITVPDAARGASALELVLQCEAGDSITFKTTAGSGGGDCVLTAWFDSYD